MTVSPLEVQTYVSDDDHCATTLDTLKGFLNQLWSVSRHSFLMLAMITLPALTQHQVHLSARPVAKALDFE